MCSNIQRAAWQFADPTNVLGCHNPTAQQKTIPYEHIRFYRRDTDESHFLKAKASCPLTNGFLERRPYPAVTCLIKTNSAVLHGNVSRQRQ